MGVTDADFSGYATKAGLKCTDGRTIMPDAFKHMDGMRVPLVWQHQHNTPENVLGHAILEARKDGMYCYGYLNDSEGGKNAKKLVSHKDISSLSIYANELVERSKQVFHGFIREVSLVLSGANPGAFIDVVAIEHSNGEIQEIDDAAIIYTGLSLTHADEDDEDLDDEDESDDDDESDELGEAQHADGGKTLGDVYDSLTDEQKTVVSYIVGSIASEWDKSAMAQSGTDNEDSEALTHQEGTHMSKNVFDQTNASSEAGEKHSLSHDAVRGIVKRAVSTGSLKAAVEEYGLQHGITDIDILFPDAKSVDASPQFDKRRTEWVDGVLSGTRHSPFSRIKSIVADLTFEQARAKGYIKGNFKKEEWFGLSKRVTTPTTMYKKQKLDRDDIIDITDLDVVAWMKAEMRIMYNEELARAILIGDGRAVDDEDKIKDPAGSNEGAGIRSILNDDDLYAASVYVNIADAASSYNEVIEAIIRARRLYKGSGSPTFYTTDNHLVSMLLLKDGNGRRLHNTVEDLKAALMVSSIVTVEVMEGESSLIGIVVNLSDYTIGTDKGGELNFFDDFDIDYNQLKYLMEGRMSGALTKIRSALLIKTVASGAALVVPVSPVQDEEEVTVVTTTGVTHKVGAFSGAVTFNGSPVTVDMTVTAAHPIVLPDGGSVTVYAVPASGSYYFANNVDDEWTFSYVDES